MFKNQFIATVRNENQQSVKKLIRAKTVNDATEVLASEGFRVLSIEKRISPFLAALKQGRIDVGSPVSKRDLASFSNQLALMGLVGGETACVINNLTSMCCVL
jgi:type II secretory pathway component PulF